jgi:hypothetical protein
MAKLKAHGYEVARVEVVLSEPSTEYSVEAGERVPVTKRYRYIHSFRSDGHIMQRIVGLDTHPDRPEGDPSRSHDWGWKLWKKLQDPKRDTVARQAALARQMARNAEQQGHTFELSIIREA